jgi:hypothetical protein
MTFSRYIPELCHLSFLESDAVVQYTHPNDSEVLVITVIFLTAAIVTAHRWTTKEKTARKIHWL